MSHRIDKINSLIKKNLGEIIMHILQDMYNRKNFKNEDLVTITEVRATRDLSQATVFISIMSENKNEIFNYINNKLFFIQGALYDKLVMKKIPKIIFKVDTSAEQVERIEKLLGD